VIGLVLEQLEAIELKLVFLVHKLLKILLSQRGKETRDHVSLEASVSYEDHNADLVEENEHNRYEGDNDNRLLSTVQAAPGDVRNEVMTQQNFVLRGHRIYSVAKHLRIGVLPQQDGKGKGNHVSQRSHSGQSKHLVVLGRQSIEVGEAKALHQVLHGYGEGSHRVQDRHGASKQQANKHDHVGLAHFVVESVLRACV